MIIRKVTLLKTICAVCICASCSGESTIYIWGTEWQTASPVLALVTLSDVGPPGSSSMMPLKYDIVDRGVTGVWQSPSGNLYYWKTTGLFVRTPDGAKSYVRFREVMPFEYGNPVIESPNKAWLAGASGDKVVFSKHYGRLWGGSDEFFGKPQATYVDISWLDNEHLIARELVMDAIDRLQRSKLVIFSPTRAPQQQRLTNLPDTQFEIAYAVSKETVAFQIYDTTKNEFVLALTQVSDPLKRIERLEFPVIKAGKPLRHEKFQEMIWNASGQYLAIRQEDGLVMVWDAMNKNWVRRTTQSYPSITTSSSPIIWVSENQIAGLELPGTFNPESPTGGLLEIFTIPAGGTDVGEIRGLTVQRMIAANQR